MPCGNEIRLKQGEIILRMMKSASRVKSAKPVVVEIPAEFPNGLIFYNRKSGVSQKPSPPMGRWLRRRNAARRRMRWNALRQMKPFH